MDHVLAEKHFCNSVSRRYMVFSKNKHNHAEHLRWVLAKLRAHKLKAKCKKSAFGLAELQYLGHIMKNSTISMDP